MVRGILRGADGRPRVKYEDASSANTLSVFCYNSHEHLKKCSMLFDMRSFPGSARASRAAFGVSPNASQPMRAKAGKGRPRQARVIDKAGGDTLPQASHTCAGTAALPLGALGVFVVKGRTVN